ncbi:MAG: T9SS type A sorting domain-containing protein [Bacteroidota bacterium]
MDGKMVQQGIITNKVETINAESLTNGLYMLSLINSKGERSVTKINKN